MSALSQFFGGGGGSGTTSTLPARVLLVDGGGGFNCSSSSFSSPIGGNSANNRSGGIGGLVIDTDISVLRGTTCPIGIGTGGKSFYCCWTSSNSNPYLGYFSTCTFILGAPGTPSNFGSFGSSTSNPVPSGITGLPGANMCRNPYIKFPITAGVYGFNNNITSCNCPINIGGIPALCSSSTSAAFVVDTINSSPGNSAQTISGCHSNGLSRFVVPSFPNINALKSRVGSPAPYGYGGPAPGGTIFCTGITGSTLNGYLSDITGCVCVYGRGGWGCWDCNGFPLTCASPSANYVYLNAHTDNFTGSGAGSHYVAGCTYPGNTPCGIPGSVTVQYPTDFGVATTSSPCVFDCSPQTPGFRTYRFLCPGSITFP